MGFRFRKSVKAGPFRINFSKSGIGYSVGGKGYRFTKKAGGGTRTTTSIPGTGISYVTETSKGSGKPQKTELRSVAPNKKEGNNMEKPKNKTTELILCILLGWAGGHKFYNGKKRMGILYLLTFGLFMVGWIGDAIKLCMARFSKNTDEQPKGIKKIAPYLIGLLCFVILGSCSGGTDTDTTLPTEPTTIIAESETSSEPTEIVTEEVTEAPTEATEPPTDAPTETPTESPTDPPETEPQGTTYVLNTNPDSMRFHEPSCSSVDTMKESNKKYYTGTREEVIEMGYIPCGKCRP